MKKVLCFLLLFITITQTYAQIQHGIVKTPTRRNVNGTMTSGKYINNATIGISFPNNNSKGTSVSDNQGKFTFAAKSPFYITSVVANKGTYTFLDADFSKKQRMYSLNDIEILVDDPNVLAQVREEAVAHERSKIRKQIRAKEDEIEALKETNKITTAEYNKMLGELSEYRQSSEAIVQQIAEVYATTDFDKIDEFNSQLLAFVEDGDFSSADSLLKTKGSKEEQFARIKETDTAIDKTIHDALKAKEYNNKAKESFTQQLYIEHIKFLQQPLMQDSALYCLKLRADLDTTNVDAVLDYALLCYNQQKYSESERYLMTCLRAYTINRDIANVASIQISIGAVYSFVNKYIASEKYYKLALENVEKLFAQVPDHYRYLLSSVQNNLGLLYNNIRDYSNSEKYFKLALENREELFKQAPDTYRASLAATQNNLGVLYSNVHDYVNSEKYYLLALENKKILISKDARIYFPDYAGALHNLGQFYIKNQDYVKSEKYLKLALENRQWMFSLNPDAFRKDLANTQASLGDLYLDLKEYSLSEMYYMTALENEEILFSQNPDAFRANIASIYNNIGNLYIALQNYHKSKFFCEKALEIWDVLYRQYPDIYRSNIALTQNNLGRACLLLRDHGRSENLLISAVEKREVLCAQNPNVYRVDLAITQSKLGELYYDLRNYVNSKKYYKLALDNYEILFRDKPEIYRSDLSQVQNTLGSVYLILQEYQKSAECLKMSLENKEILFASNPDEYREGLAILYWNIMLLCDNGRNVEMYETALLRSLELFKTLYESKPDGYRAYVIKLQNILTSKLLTIGNVDEAFKWAEKTYNIDTSNKESIYYLAQCYRMKSLVLIQNSQYKEAIDSIENAICLIPQDAMLYHTKGETLLRQNKNEEALAMWKKVLEINPDFLKDYPDGTDLSNGLKKLGLIE